jgi:hypothetical protein
MTEKQYFNSIQESVNVLDDITDANKKIFSDVPLEEVSQIFIDAVNSGVNLDEAKALMIDYLNNWFAETKFGEIGLEVAVVQEQAMKTVGKWYDTNIINTISSD